MARPKDGKEVKKIISFRIEPKLLKRIIKSHGSFSKWVNEKLKGDEWELKQTGRGN